MTRSNHSRKKKIREKNQKQQMDRHRFSRYAAEVLIIGTVVTAALFFPQLIFWVEDNILCGDITLGQRESMNAESLSTTYERSLGKRMGNFARGLAENKKYYVTSQNLTVDDELTEYLYSDKGLYQGFFQHFFYYMFPAEIWEEQYYAVSWKQYVIYSDDFEEGVYFILWYIELQDADGGVIKLLTDAEDGTMYGIKTENSSLPGSGLSYRELILSYSEGAIEAWTYYALYYEAMPDEPEDDISESEGKRKDEITDVDSDRYGMVSSDYSEEGVKHQLLSAFSYRNEAENRGRFSIPYGNAELDVILYVEEQEKERFYLFPNTTVGVSQIYEMIPEFA